MVRDSKAHGFLRTLSLASYLLSDEAGEKWLRHHHQSEMGISLTSKRIALLHHALLFVPVKGKM